MGTGDWNDGLDEIGSQGRGESVWLGLLPLLHPRSDGRHRREARRARPAGILPSTGWRPSRTPSSSPGGATAICGRSMTTAPRSAWRGAASGRSTRSTAAWAVMSGINPERGRIVFETALSILEKETTILLGWPPLREDTKPYLGRSSWYPEGVRENGMYCHGVQWLVGAARILAEQARPRGQTRGGPPVPRDGVSAVAEDLADPPRREGEIETYGGQPNKQAADMVTTFDPGRMIWNGYTGAAGWMFRQALEGVLGFASTPAGWSPRPTWRRRRAGPGPGLPRPLAEPLAGPRGQRRRRSGLSAEDR